MRAEEPLNQEVMLYAKDGREVWAAQFVSPVRNADGLVIQHFASFWDITRRVRAERRTQRLNEILEQRVADRTQELQAELSHWHGLEEVLMASLREKDELLGREAGCCSRSITGPRTASPWRLPCCAFRSAATPTRTPQRRWRRRSSGSITWRVFTRSSTSMVRATYKLSRWRGTWASCARTSSTSRAGASGTST